MESWKDAFKERIRNPWSSPRTWRVVSRMNYEKDELLVVPTTDGFVLFKPLQNNPCILRKFRVDGTQKDLPSRNLYGEAGGSYISCPGGWYDVDLEKFFPYKFSDRTNSNHWSKSINNLEGMSLVPSYLSTEKFYELTNFPSMRRHSVASDVTGIVQSIDPAYIYKNRIIPKPKDDYKKCIYFRDFCFWYHEETEGNFSQDLETNQEYKLPLPGQVRATILHEAKYYFIIRSLDPVPGYVMYVAD